MKIHRVRTSVVCVHQNKILGFRAEDPANKKEYFFLPGGKIEADETAPEAAARETLEETGFTVLVDEKNSVDKEYLFQWNNQIFDCLTIFYPASLSSPFAKKVQDTDYHLGVEWIEKSEVDKAFSYCPEIRDAVIEILTLHGAIHF